MNIFSNAVNWQLFALQFKHSKTHEPLSRFYVLDKVSSEVGSTPLNFYGILGVLVSSKQFLHTCIYSKYLNKLYNVSTFILSTYKKYKIYNLRNTTGCCERLITLTDMKTCFGWDCGDKIVRAWIQNKIMKILSFIVRSYWQQKRSFLWNIFFTKSLRIICRLLSVCQRSAYTMQSINAVY